LAKNLIDDYYSAETKKERFKIAASNSEKIENAKNLIKKHRAES